MTKSELDDGFCWAGSEQLLTCTRSMIRVSLVGEIRGHRMGAAVPIGGQEGQNGSSKQGWTCLQFPSAWMWTGPGVPDWARLQHPLVLTRVKEGV